VSLSVVDWAGLGAALIGLYVSWRAFWCNVRHVRTARAAAPLDGLDLSEAEIVPTSTPRRWPVVEELDDPQAAAAYASLADDHAVALAILGELLVLMAGATVGATLPGFGHTRESWIIAAGGLAAVIGFMVRLVADRYWAAVSQRYAQRYAVLTALPPVTAPRARAGWFRRR
jgi:hypothetical protein